MQLIRLESEIDFDGWRGAARALIAEDVPPADVEWTVGGAPSLLAEENRGRAPFSGAELRVRRAFVTLAQSAILHSAPDRFALLYRLLWRINREPRLIEVASDVDVSRVRALSDAVHREIHKTHAFVRFREVSSEAGPVYIAWFEPAHHTLEAAAPFFVRRFASMRWSILTPRVSAHWDGESLRFGAAATQAQAPQGDALEDLWRTYYASIFNPARLKTDTMRAQMPRKYWRNLPEAELIGELVAGASRTTQQMIAQPPTEPRLRAPARPKAPLPHQGEGWDGGGFKGKEVQGGKPGFPSLSSTGQPPAGPGEGGDGGGFKQSEAGDSRRLEPPSLTDLDSVRSEAHRCTACPLYRHATQTVFGEGPAAASVMFVGEQPGDHEDLEGRPFVGPAGQLFDRALGEAEIPRRDVYVTNAVKHFKFEPRGKRRLHKTPAQQEIEACRGWLEQEIALVQPRLIVALGATAANALLGRPTPVQKNRGNLIKVSEEIQVLITVHPSYLLRVPEQQKAEEYRRFVEDLKLVQPFATADVG